MSNAEVATTQLFYCVSIPYSGQKCCAGAGRKEKRRFPYAAVSRSWWFFPLWDVSGPTTPNSALLWYLYFKMTGSGRLCCTSLTIFPYIHNFLSLSVCWNNGFMLIQIDVKTIVLWSTHINQRSRWTIVELICNNGAAVVFVDAIVV